MKNKVSIVMTTYNGEKYVLEQLISLLNQTRKADEIIIADDMSTDSTERIVDSFIKENDLKNWKLIINTTNVGWVQNFHNVTKCASGDFVFFCDQDDIWDVVKIEEMMKIMTSYEEINVLSCKAKYINGKNESINVSQNVLPFGVIEADEILKKNKFNRRYMYSIMPGCTMCVRRKFIDYIYGLDFDPQLPHDALFWKTAILTDSCFLYNKALISYRIHDTNASLPATSASLTLKKRQKRIDEAIVFKKQLEEVMKLDSKMHSLYSSRLQELLDFLKFRVDFLEKKEFWNVLKYISYYRDKKMLIGDLIIRCRK